MEERDRELLRLLKGSPMSVAEIARQIGESEDDARARVDRLIASGKAHLENGRLYALDPAADAAPPDRPIP